MSAFCGVAVDIPGFLITLHRMTTEDYSKIALPMAITMGVVRIVVAFAILSLAVTLQGKKSRLAKGLQHKTH